MRSRVVEGLWLRVEWLWREVLPGVEEALLEIGGEAYARRLIDRSATRLIHPEVHSRSSSR